MDQQDKEKTTKYVPDDLYDMHPHDLHTFAEFSKEDRILINRMDRDRYLRRWYISCINNCYYYPMPNKVKHALDNYWYYALYFSCDTFPELMKQIDKVDNKSLLIFIKDIPLFSSYCRDIPEPHPIVNVKIMLYDITKLFKLLVVKASILDKVIDIARDYDSVLWKNPTKHDIGACDMDLNFDNYN